MPDVAHGYCADRQGYLGRLLWNRIVGGNRKLIERIIGKRLSKIELHDDLHGFRAKRGCGTGIMEAKYVQQLAYWEQAPHCFVSFWT